MPTPKFEAIETTPDISKFVDEELEPTKKFKENLQLVHHKNTKAKATKSWLPPNDKELFLRGSVRTGWSSRNCKHSLNRMKKTNNNQNNQEPMVSLCELARIEEVLSRAAKIENKEIYRVNVLHDQFCMINHPKGNGHSSCLICNTSFGFFGVTPKTCQDCFKNVCRKCGIPALSQTPLWLCFICAEYRDLLKKTGAWFNKRAPLNQLFSSQSNLGILNNTLKADFYVLSPENFGPVKSDEKSELNQSNCSEKSVEEIKESLSDETNSNKNVEEKEGMAGEEEEEEQSYSREKSYDESQYETQTDSSHATKSSESTNSSIDSKIINHKSNIETELDLIKIYSTKQYMSSTANFDKTELSKISFQKKREPSENLNEFDFDSKNIHDLIAASRQNSTNSGHFTSTSSSSHLNISNKKHNSKLGSIQFTVEYIQSAQQLRIHLISATSLAACDSNGLSDPYVKLHLLPGNAKATKLRSKTVYKNLNPVFNETLHYDGITSHDIDAKTLRVSVLDEDKFGFDFIGEYRLPLKTLILNEMNHFDVGLEEKKNLGDETDSTARGKISFALKFCKDSSCLYVKIKRCQQLLPMDNGKSSDPFVKISILPYDKEKQKAKTSIRWKTLEPEFNEEFQFANVDLKTLLNKTVQISVWHKDWDGRKKLIGVVNLGQDKNGDELKHFFAMIKNPNAYNEMWHSLHLDQVEVGHEIL